jgi:hypothetical protein
VQAQRQSSLQVRYQHLRVQRDNLISAATVAAATTSATPVLNAV